MREPTLMDRYQIARMLAAGKSLPLVDCANPHLQRAQVEQIAEASGYPDTATLNDTATALWIQIEAERDTIPTGKTAGDIAAARQARPVLAAQTTEPTITLPPHTADLLTAARQSSHKRTTALADKIETLLTDLKTRLHAETQAARDAQKRDRQRQEALAEVAAAEEALRLAREKARRYKNHPGGNGRATTTRAPSSESRRPGGIASRPHLAENRNSGRQYQNDLVQRCGCTIADIRAWANEQGLNPGRGSRIARTILDAFEAAHPSEEAS